IEVLLATEGVDPDYQDNRGQTPLWWATGGSHEEATKMILAFDDCVNPVTKNTWGKTPLFLNSSLQRCVWTQIRGTTSGRHAAQNGHVCVVKLLLASHVNPDSEGRRGKTPLLKAFESIQERTRGSSQTFACNGSGQPNFRDLAGRTALSWAAEHGHEDLLSIYLSAVDKLNLTDPAIREKPPCSTWLRAVLGQWLPHCLTPLEMAAYCGYATVVRMLLAAGADPNTQDSLGDTPLSSAASCEPQDGEAIVKLLLATEGIHLNPQDHAGRTPLSIAAEAGHKAVRDLLFTMEGVDPGLGDFEDRTPLSWAEDSGNEAVAELIRDRLSCSSAKAD
ncbi:hypothetical protein N7451_002361, partial [Penicillium sp. IBT 35674x]